MRTAKPTPAPAVRLGAFTHGPAFLDIICGKCDKRALPLHDALISRSLGLGAAFHVRVEPGHLPNSGEGLVTLWLLYSPRFGKEGKRH
jgi:hypothetical protein